MLQHLEEEAPRRKKGRSLIHGLRDFNYPNQSQCGIGQKQIELSKLFREPTSSKVSIVVKRLGWCILISWMSREVQPNLHDDHLHNLHQIPISRFSERDSWWLYWIGNTKERMKPSTSSARSRQSLTSRLMELDPLPPQDLPSVKLFKKPNWRSRITRSRWNKDHRYVFQVSTTSRPSQ